MAHTDKNIVITPNIGSSTEDPKIVFSGADASASAQNITIKAYPTSNGTLSIEGSSGQLFSVTNSMSGSIFSVNDVSGIPSIEVLDSGLIKFGQYSGNIVLGTGTDSGYKLDVNGSARVSGQFISTDTWDSATGGGGIYLNATTGNRIEWNQQGIASPAFTTRSAGTKLLLYPLISGSTGDYALGIENNNMWFSVPENSGTGFKWYGGTTNYMSLLATGILSVVTGFRINNGATSGQYLRGNGTNFVSSAIQAADVPTLNQNTTGSAGSVANALTINSSGTGVASGSTYNGSAAVTISYNTVGAAASSHTHNYAGSASAGGAASSLSNFTVTTTTSVGAENTTSAIGYIAGISLLGQSDGALYSHLYSADWKHQIYGDYRTGQIAIRGKNNGTWQTWRTVLDSSNYNSYSPTLTGGGASGSWGISVTGNAATATALLGTESDWASYRTRSVANMLSWKNYGNGHIIFDASNGTSPTGSAVNNTNSAAAWTGTYPTLMGWNGSATYGVRVDSARIADTLTTGNNYQVNSLGVNTAASGTAGEIRATNNITAYYSDKRLKNILGTIPNALGKINSISGVYFTQNEKAEEFGYYNYDQQVGVIAQEIQKILPEAIKPAPFDIEKDEDGNEYSKSGENYLTVQYEKLVPLLIEGIKEQQKTINSLKCEIEQLKLEVKNIK